MIVTVTNFKGGVAKTTTAIHLAAYLQKEKPTMLVDGDLNRSATAWSKRGKLPFLVIDERQAVRYGRQYEHVVIDTPARPQPEDLQALAGGCDLLIIPTSPDLLSLDALMQIVDSLRAMKVNHYRILITMAPPKPNKDAEETRQLLIENDIPVLNATIRRLIAFQKAVIMGTTVDLTKDPRAKEAWHDYCDAGKEILS